MVEALKSDTLAGLPHVAHGFFTRSGGVSTGIYASLNAGLGSSDERAAVLENRARVADALGAHTRAVVTVYQIHSAEAVVVDHRSSGDLPKADALVTRTPGLAIGVLAADCAPVLFADPDAGVIAAAHAGWRGALAGIVEATLARMIEIGAARERIAAVVGPCIGPEAYEVGPEFQKVFEQADPTSTRFFRSPAQSGRPHFDLPGYVEARLLRAGLAATGRLTPCTYQNEDRFFSFRRTTHRNEPDYGRHISAIVLTER